MRLSIQILLVAIGSAVGGLTRWGASEAIGHLLGRTFPWGTFLINITGSFFLGWLYTILADRLLADSDTQAQAEFYRLLLGVGFAGGYTTFSSYEWEGHQLFHGGHLLKATFYLGGSVFAGLLALHLGMLLARWK